MSDFAARLEAVARTRELAAKTLAEVLREVTRENERISEVGLRDRWLARLRSGGPVFPDGWYTPPPHGMIVLFATDNDPARISHSSYRGPETWPRDDIFLDHNRGLIMLYASPVDRATGMIGDFCTVLYFGQNPELRAHLAKCLNINVALANEAAVGMKFSELAEKAVKLLEQHGSKNDVASQTDPAGTNIGHSIPAIETGWNSQEQGVLRQAGWDRTKDMISHKRLFVSTAEQALIARNSAFTVEPRPEMVGRSDLPKATFHTIVAFRDGQKQFLSNFDELFALAGMDYMPKLPDFE